MYGCATRSIQKRFEYIKYMTITKTIKQIDILTASEHTSKFPYQWLKGVFPRKIKVNSSIFVCLIQNDKNTVHLWLKVIDIKQINSKQIKFVAEITDDRQLDLWQLSIGDLVEVNSSQVLNATYNPRTY